MSKIQNGDQQEEEVIEEEPEEEIIEEVKEKTASDWIQELGLEPHPIMERGFYKETFRDPTQVQILSADGSQLTRSASTLIFYLHLPVGQLNNSTLFYKSTCSSVTMHFHAGQPVSLYFLSQVGTQDFQVKRVKLGLGGAAKDEVPHAVIRKGTWFSRILEQDDRNGGSSGGGSYSLIGVNVSPGFEYTDMKTASFESLVQMKPNPDQIQSG